MLHLILVKYNETGRTEYENFCHMYTFFCSYMNRLLTWSFSRVI
jgi:hypothetical protein